MPLASTPTPAPSSLVSISSLCKRYGQGAIILDNLNLEVAQGEFVTLIGPSGCGKSTLLKLIASLSPVTSGAIAVDNLPPQQARGEMAFIFQEPTLLPWRTVLRNVELPLAVKGMDRAQRTEIAHKMLKMVGLSHVPNHYPRQLSGGMKMRVSIARALTLYPKILLLDEPFGALDEMTRDRLNEQLLAIRQAQKFTAFFVTHSVAEAVFLSSHIVVLSANPGRVHRILPVPFPYPRSVATREAPEFQQCVTEVSRVLRAITPEQK